MGSGRNLLRPLNTKRMQDLNNDAIIFSFNSSVWTRGLWKKRVNYRKLEQVLAPVPSAVLNVVSLLEQINMASSTCYVATHLTNMFFFILTMKNVHVQFTFTWFKQLTDLWLCLRDMLILKFCYDRVSRDVEHVDILQNILLVCYIDDIMLIGLDEKELKGTFKSLVKHLWTRKWEIKPSQIHTSEFFKSLVGKCPATGPAGV